jgi:beta-phosphoglucomutase-like phosphatase (HAD superfamily)
MSSAVAFANTSTFSADGVLFDMVSTPESGCMVDSDFQDGTLTDSIAAVEAAWSAKAEELGLEPEAVIAATHGRRASDNLQELIPSLRKEHVEKEVEGGFFDALPTN